MYDDLGWSLDLIPWNPKVPTADLKTKCITQVHRSLDLSTLFQGIQSIMKEH